LWFFLLSTFFSLPNLLKIIWIMCKDFYKVKRKRNSRTMLLQKWSKNTLNTSRRSCLSSFQILDFLGYQSRFFCHSFYARFLPEKPDLNILVVFL
jgi:hypothetical protein